MNLLTINNLTLSYSQNLLLNDIDMHVSNGETVGVLGVNGAGKTTLFDLICRVKSPDSGEIINHAKNQAYLTQILTPPPLLRMHEAGELITLLNCSHPPSQHEMLSRLANWSTHLAKRYADISKKKASTCSYGEIRSYFTLTLLLMQSDLIILDEPTAGVDPEFRHYIWLGIHHACQEGATVLVSSHYTEEIAMNCHRFYMLAHRKLEAFDCADQFLARHQAKTLDQAFIQASQ
ncbi:ATP-binding cassette domain-containing protein [Pseudomonas putida]|uniref:ATP-binding cassette domain-containing protein n=1 Tax=Pseudomonas putida TaxID=303 RepID=UPI0009A14E8C|nr:ATP-binding cassette domain-containing protein [Pseudomonas putida]